MGVCIKSVVSSLPLSLLSVRSDSVNSLFVPGKQRTLFLHSHLGSPLSVGPRGENTIVRRIIVGHTLPGQIILDNLNSAELDNIELPPMLSEMHFSLRDIYGRPVEIDHSISFSLVIKEFPRGK